MSAHSFTKSDRRTLRMCAAALAVVALVSLTAPASAQDWRALALTSFDEVWETINASFYDPTFGGLDWAAVKATYRPKVEAASSMADARSAIRAMLASLGQSHFELLADAEPTSPAGSATIAADVRVIGDALVVTHVDEGSPAARAGLSAGDRVLAIDDANVASWFAAATGTDRARQLAVWERAFRALHGVDGTIVSVRVTSGVVAAARTLRIARREDPGEPVALGNLPVFRVRTRATEYTIPRGRRVGYIGFNVWMAAVDEPFAAAVDAYRHDAGLVIDLRGNPGGLAEMIRGIAGHLVSEPVVLGRLHLRTMDLEFRANPRLSTTDGRRVEPFAGPVAVLVDELTASASECFTGGLQSVGRVRVFGARTMGEALPASTKRLSDGDVLLYAVGDFVTSTGLRLEGNGVQPDEPVALKITDLRAGKDAPLSAALAWVASR